MAAQHNNRTNDHFSLQPLRAALKGYVPPDSGIAPSGAWSAEYRLYSLAGKANPKGGLVLTRKAPTDGQIHFDSVYTLDCGSGVQFRTTGQVHCRDDILSTPLRWQSQSGHVYPKGRETADTRGHFSGKFINSSVLIETAGTERAYPAGSNLAWGWGLFDVVQRLAVMEDPGPLSFDLLDHFDQIKRQHRLRLRKQCTVLFGGKMVVQEIETRLDRGTIYRPEQVEKGGISVDCVVFEQVGRGILPIVYWCTTSGQLLIVSSGLEAYVRQSGGNANA